MADAITEELSLVIVDSAALSLVVVEPEELLLVVVDFAALSVVGVVTDDPREVVVDVEESDDVDPAEEDGGVETGIGVVPETSEDEDVESVDDGVLEFDTLPPEPSAPDPLSPLSNSATVQDCTSWTAGLPFASVIGVRVIVHVWVMGPATV
jgi:hypothetical protein